MALTIGELVGFIDLDDSGAERGVTRTQGAMEGLQRDTDGRLRDTRGRFAAAGADMGASLGEGIGTGAEEARAGLAGIGPAIGAARTSTMALSGAAVAATGALAAVPLAVIGLGAAVLKENEQVKGAFFDLRDGAHGDHVTAVGRALVSRGFGDAYKVGPGPNWTDADTANYRAYQLSLGYHGADADGVPGETSLRKLLGTLPGDRTTVDLSKLRAAARQDPPKSGTPVSYSGARVVEEALAAEGLLDRRYVDGHFGTKTVSAYSRWQRRCGYSGAAADGIPGRASLSTLGRRHGFQVAA
ncbi:MULTISPECIES: peptidoglycan-binding protein [Streptomyces]|uniref:peptidoglycan-binding protein n=1 Tax=Streptomyces TaxID=1883 RepID=UPI0022496160|nr:peptidoglycan-binding protein [Streptomyces sp. JHD 1]MCX2971203.1 peptidoglycan-binding protein [Streptomyces sp. JHD 1]